MYGNVFDELDVVVSLDDPNASYDFDTFVVWRHKKTGELYYGQDSGCSCPSPFEGISRIEELSRLGDLPSFERELEAWADRYFDAQVVSDVIDKIRVVFLYKTMMIL